MVGKLFPSHNSEILGDILINFEPLLHTYSTSLKLKHLCKSLICDLRNLRKDSIIYHTHKKKQTTNTTLHTTNYHTNIFYDTLTNDCISQQNLSFHVCAGLTSKKGTSVMSFAYNFEKKRRCFDPMNREFGQSLFINMIRISMSYY